MLNSISSIDNNDALLECNVVSLDSLFSNFSKDERNYLSMLLGNMGHCQGAACTAMPYMLPDNNSEASSALLEMFLNNKHGNKLVTSKLTGIVRMKNLHKDWSISNICDIISGRIRKTKIDYENLY